MMFGLWNKGVVDSIGRLAVPFSEIGPALVLQGSANVSLGANCLPRPQHLSPGHMTTAGQTGRQAYGHFLWLSRSESLGDPDTYTKVAGPEWKMDNLAGGRKCEKTKCPSAW